MSDDFALSPLVFLITHKPRKNVPKGINTKDANNKLVDISPPFAPVPSPGECFCPIGFHQFSFTTNACSPVFRHNRIIYRITCGALRTHPTQKCVLRRKGLYIG